MPDLIFVKELSIFITSHIEHRFIIDAQLPQQDCNDKRPLQLPIYSKVTNSKASFLAQEILHSDIIKLYELKTFIEII